MHDDIFTRSEGALDSVFHFQLTSYYQALHVIADARVVPYKPDSYYKALLQVDVGKKTPCQEHRPIEFKDDSVHMEVGDDDAIDAALAQLGSDESEEDFGDLGADLPAPPPPTSGKDHEPEPKAHPVRRKLVRHARPGGPIAPPSIAPPVLPPAVEPPLPPPADPAVEPHQLPPPLPPAAVEPHPPPPDPVVPGQARCGVYAAQQGVCRDHVSWPFPSLLNY